MEDCWEKCSGVRGSEGSETGGVERVRTSAPSMESETDETPGNRRHRGVNIPESYTGVGKSVGSRDPGRPGRWGCPSRRDEDELETLGRG